MVPDTPEAQQRVKEEFASIGRGTDTSGVVLELRRKDNGKPIWIQWWSKPEPGGKYTRTMFASSPPSAANFARTTGSGRGPGLAQCCYPNLATTIRPSPVNHKIYRPVLHLEAKASFELCVGLLLFEREFST
jgi:hypothetical protein